MSKKGNKRYTDQKEKIKLSLFIDALMVYIENPKVSINQLLELTSGFIEVAEYKIYIQKSIVFLYISNEHVKIKLKTQYNFKLHKKKHISVLKCKSNITCTGLECL